MKSIVLFLEEKESSEEINEKPKRKGPNFFIKSMVKHPILTSAAMSVPLAFGTAAALSNSFPIKNTVRVFGYRQS